MVEAEDVGIRDGANGIGRTNQKPSRAKLTIIGKTNTDESTESKPADTPDDGSSQSTPKSGRLIVEDVPGNSHYQSQQKGVKKETPKPSAVAASVARQKMTPEAAKSTANMFVSLIEVGAVSLTGLKAAEFTPFERQMIMTPLARRLESLPITAAERIGPWVDWAFIGFGLFVYSRRLAMLQAQKVSQSKGVQEDVKAPVASPVEKTVPTTKAGDVDHLATPVPPIFSDYMNQGVNGLA